MMPRICDKPCIKAGFRTDILKYEREYPLVIEETYKTPVISMRILAVTNMYPTPQFPSSGSFVEQQIRGMRRIGLNVEVLFFNRLQQGIRVYAGLREQLQARIKSFRPDIVHSMYGGIMADRVTQHVVDQPTVVTFHGSDLLGEHLSGVVRKFVAGYGVFASRRAAQRATRVVVVSQVLSEALPKSVDRAKVSLIPCGIDLERFRPMNQDECRHELGWQPERFHILFPSHPSNTVKRASLAQAAVQLLKRLDVPAELHYLHGVTNSQVPVWLNASDVLIMTSQHEGSPTIVKEALGCNRPIVAVAVGDIEERIAGVDGCHVALAQPDDLANKLCAVYTGCRIVNGRVRVQDLSLTAIAARLQDLYRELIHHSAAYAHNAAGETPGL